MRKKEQRRKSILPRDALFSFFFPLVYQIHRVTGAGAQRASSQKVEVHICIDAVICLLSHIHTYICAIGYILKNRVDKRRSNPLVFGVRRAIVGIHILRAINFSYTNKILFPFFSVCVRTLNDSSFTRRGKDTSFATTYSRATFVPYTNSSTAFKMSCLSSVTTQGSAERIQRQGWLHRRLSEGLRESDDSISARTRMDRSTKSTDCRDVWQHG